MAKRRVRQTSSILEIFVDPLFGAFGAFLFIFLMVILMLGDLIVRDPEILTPERLPSAHNGIYYEIALSAREGAGFYRWSKDGAGVPQGLDLDPVTGIISGIPVLAPGTSGHETFTFEVTVSSKERVPETRPASRLLKLTVLRDDIDEICCTALPEVQIISPDMLPDMRGGAFYRLQLAASGGLSPYTWDATELPEWLTLSDSGELTGTAPNTAQDILVEFNSRVNDARGASASGTRAAKNLAVTIRPTYPPPQELSIVSDELPAGAKGVEYAAMLLAEGGFSPYTWEVSGLPEGLALTDGNKISGVPSTPGDYEVTITVADTYDNRVHLDNPILLRIHKGAKSASKFWIIATVIILILIIIFILFIVVVFKMCPNCLSIRTRPIGDGFRHCDKCGYEWRDTTRREVKNQ